LTPHNDGTVAHRICLIGAECTGKSSLARMLAQRLGGVVVAEALRDFCLRHGRTPYAHEQAGLMATQIELETKALAKVQESLQTRPPAPTLGPHPGFVWCDGAPLLTAVYSAYYFADQSLLAAALQHHTSYALTLWLQSDLPWQADGFMRDGPAAQTAVHALLRQVLADLPRVVPIHGEHPQRIRCAFKALQPIENA